MGSSIMLREQVANRWFTPKFSELQQNITGNSSSSQAKSTSERESKPKVKASTLTVSSWKSVIVERNGNVQLRITFW